MPNTQAPVGPLDHLVGSYTHPSRQFQLYSTIADLDVVVSDTRREFLQNFADYSQMVVELDLSPLAIHFAKEAPDQYSIEFHFTSFTARFVERSVAG